MQVIQPLKVVALLFSLFLGSLASGPDGDARAKLRETLNSSQLNGKEQGKEASLSLEELAQTINSLTWLTRLFQHEKRLSYELGLDNLQLLKDLDRYKSENNIEKGITEASNKLFDCIMKSDSKPDKTKILRAANPYLNDATTTYLIDSYIDKVSEQNESSDSNKFKDLSSTMNFLSIGKIKTKSKNSDNSGILLTVNDELPDMTKVDSHIWFLFAQQKFYPASFDEFNYMTGYITDIIEYKIILRADVDIERLLDSMIKTDKEFRKVYNYIVEKSTPNDKQLYDGHVNWRSISELLLLEDPKFTANFLDVNLSTGTRGSRSYLLLLHDNPVKRLVKCELNGIYGMYSCFVLVLNVRLYLLNIRHLQEIPKEKLVELACRLAEQLKGNAPKQKLELQFELPYLNMNLLSLSDNNTFLYMNYSRKFAELSKTFELLDVIGNKIMDFEVIGKPFNEYLLENRNWVEAARKHFHYLISLVITKNCHKIPENIIEYIGTSPQKVLVGYRHQCLRWVNRTLDKVPPHLNSYFEIIDKQSKGKEMKSPERLGIAIIGGISNDKDTKEDFVYYKLRNSPFLSISFSDPIFVDLARIHRQYNRHDYIKYMPSLKFGNSNHDQFLPFLHFEHFVYMRFSSLTRMDLERSFQRLYAKNSFSMALRMIFDYNFRGLAVPFVIKGLQSLEKEMFKYHPEIAIGIQLDMIPIMELLKAIYMAFADPFPDLKLNLIKYIYNAQLLYKSLA